MEGVKRGGDRQELHEKVRVLSMEAADQVKQYGKPNDLISRIIEDATFDMTEDELYNILKPENFIGCAALQVDDFITKVINPILKTNQDVLGIDGDVRV